MSFVYEGREVFNVEHRAPVAHFVMRDRFDAWLAQRAVRAGAQLCHGDPVVSLEETADGVSVKTAAATYTARFAVGADGAHSVVARWLNGARPRRRTYGLEAEVTSDPPLVGEVILEMGAVPGGYGWTFPKQRGVSIGIGGFQRVDPRPKARFRRFVALQPGLRGSPSAAPIGHPIPIYSNGIRLASLRVGLAGDAGHLVDPFFGEGIYYGVLSGQHLGRAIVHQLERGAADLSPYAQWVERELYPEFESANRLASLAYGYPRLWYEAMRAHPDVIGWFFDVLGGTSSFQQLWGRLRRNVFRLAPRALAARAAAVFTR
jgi:flavin-dependent dehydrogenase